jgi:putative nucleic acid binding protein
MNIYRQDTTRIDNIFKQNLDAQAQKLVEPYIGKWLRIAGLVNNAAHHPKMWQVFLHFEIDGSLFGIQVVLYFADTWNEHLSMVTRDTNITVIGRIVKVHSGGIELQACELENV